VGAAHQSKPGGIKGKIRRGPPLAAVHKGTWPRKQTGAGACMSVALEGGIKDVWRNQPIQVSKTRWDAKRSSLCHCETAVSSLTGFGGQKRFLMTGGR